MSIAAMLHEETKIPQAIRDMKAYMAGKKAALEKATVNPYKAPIHKYAWTQGHQFAMKVINGEFSK